MDTPRGLCRSHPSACGLFLLSKNFSRGLGERGLGERGYGAGGLGERGYGAGGAWACPLWEHRLFDGGPFVKG